MESQKINWAHDFTINELLHTTAQALSGVYGRLMFHFPDHDQYTSWEKQGLHWAQYEQTIETLDFDSQSQGEGEVEHLSSELREMLEFEKVLLKASGKIQ